MKNAGYINLEPYEWRQTVSCYQSKRYSGRGLRMSARVVDADDIHLVNTDEKLNNVTAFIGIEPGPPMSEGKPFTDGIGMFVFHEKKPGGDDYGPSDAMIVGWFCLDPEEYEEAWSQIARDNYASCAVTLLVGPFGHHGPEWEWDVGNRKQLFVDNASISFSRTRLKKEEPPQKRGFFR